MQISRLGGKEATTKYLSLHLLPSRVCIGRKLEPEEDPELILRHPNVGGSIPGGVLTSALSIYSKKSTKRKQSAEGLFF